LNRNKH